MNYITLATEIEGYVVANDKVCTATIVGVSDDQLVALVNDGISITASRVREVFPDKLHAEATLRNLRTDRRLIERLDAEEAERQAA